MRAGCHPWDTAVLWMDRVEKAGKSEVPRPWVAGQGSWLAVDENKVGWAGGRANGMSLQGFNGEGVVWRQCRGRECPPDLRTCRTQREVFSFY